MLRFLVNSMQLMFAKSLPFFGGLLQIVRTFSRFVAVWARHQMSVYPVLMDKKPAGGRFERPVIFPTYSYKKKPNGGDFLVLNWLQDKQALGQEV